MNRLLPTLCLAVAISFSIVEKVIALECKGLDPCPACRDCSQCWFCDPKNPKRQSCGTCRDQDGAAAKKRESKRKK